MVQLESELLVKCRTLYEAMDKSAEDTPEGRFWVGPLTVLLRDISQSGTSSNYSQVVGAMTDMGCISQIKKGGGKAPSVWRLDRPPSSEISHLISNTRNNYKSQRQEQSDNRVTALNERLTRVEKDIAAIVAFLNEHYKAGLVQEDE